MPQLARRMGRAKPSAIMVVAEKAKALKAEGRDIISFSIGVPNFLPGEHVYAAAREALAKDSGQYGSQPRRRRAARRLPRAHRGGRPDRLHAGPLRDRHRRQAHALQPGRGAARRRRHHRLRDAVLDQLRRHRRHLQREASRAAVPGRARTTRSRRRSSTRRWRRSRRSSCSTIPSTRPAWSTRKAEIEALADVLVEASGHLGRRRRHLQPHGVRRHRLPQLRALRGRRCATASIFVDSLSKTYGMPGWRVGFMAGPGVGRQGGDHAQFQPHHQHAGSGHRRRGGRAVRSAGRADARRTPSSRPSATR